MCKCNSKYKYNYRYKYKYDKRYKSTNTRYKKILPDHSNHCQSHVDNVDGMAARLEVYLGEKGSTHIYLKMILREGVKKIRFFLGLCPKLWVGGGLKS